MPAHFRARSCAQLVWTGSAGRAAHRLLHRLGIKATTASSHEPSLAVVGGRGKAESFHGTEIKSDKVRFWPIILIAHPAR
jgi:hypothetical protein